MKIKICGMRNPENIKEVALLQPDYMGFIFYEKSPRYVLTENNLESILNLPKGIKKVGVFVNNNLDEILDKVNEFGLDVVQLHGNEDVNLCLQLKNKDIEVFKVFSADSNFDFNITHFYENAVDAFLFDTKGEAFGGHGTSFDWKILDQYNGTIPFFLAGGISLENLAEVKKLQLSNFIGIDVNSKFEVEPGLKNVKNLKLLFELI